MNWGCRLILIAGLVVADAAGAATSQPDLRQEAGFACPDGTALRLVMVGNQAFLRSGDGPARVLLRLSAAQLRYQSASEQVQLTGGGARWQRGGTDMLCVGAAPAALPPGFARDGDTLVHRQSGMHFPPFVAGFVRDLGASYDGSGDYVVVRYLKRLGSGVMEARAGLVHLEGMQANEHYAGFSGQVLADLGGGTRMGEGPVAVAGQTSAARGYAGRFVSADGQRGAMLITVALGHWSARLRSEWPAGEATEGRRQLAMFARGLDWQPALQAPAAEGQR